ncbi:MAG: LysM domain-containing protein [Candidatus Gastranaerophilales bacterium]
MKSSTIRRSNLSKEKMEVLEALSRFKQENYDSSPNVYVRQNKEEQIDVLWDGFKTNTKSGWSPNVYLASGFVAGAVSMLILMTLINVSTRNVDVNEVNSAKSNQEVGVNYSPSTQKNPEYIVSNEVYTVQSGDTIEAIVIKFYGSFSLEKEALVLRANNMANPNRLSIGQKLNIPMSVD